jgi:two-component system nitrogen regulation response regulator GlnG
VHALGPRRSQAFVAVNAATLSAELGASQLFGHVRGAFTGADVAVPGYFGAAHHGTLFLDEIGACPVDVQALLLRALESGEVQVVGGPTRTVDVRVIAATDVDLAAAVRSGGFRAPLYHRLAQRVIRLAPLRERPVDIAAQAVHFLREGLHRLGRDWPASGPDDPPWLGRGFVEALLAWSWPGNTRELRALIARTLERDLDAPTCGPPPFEPLVARAGDDRPAEPTPAGPREPDTSLAAVEAALARCDYRLSAAAELLGVSRNTLKKRMEAARLRRPIDIDADELRAALAREGGVSAAARALRVSEHGLRIRLTQLGLGE